ncbi:MULTISPECIES: hypothetical protein [Streptomyces]|nr:MULTISPECIES: hypothetical protein [Streptomyces]
MGAHEAGRRLPPPEAAVGDGDLAAGALFLGFAVKLSPASA